MSSMFSRCKYLRNIWRLGAISPSEHGGSLNRTILGIRSSISARWIQWPSVQPKRVYSGSTCTGQGKVEDGLNQPLSANELPRIGGISSMFRLPIHQTTQGLDACFVGVPMDIGTSTRSGTRFGPRLIRVESNLIRQENIDTGAVPYKSLNVADIGDVNFNLYSLPDAVVDIQTAFAQMIVDGCKTIAIGGDHTITYPILQAYKEKYGPMGLVHVDAHADINDEMSGSKIAHGTPFRRAVEEGLLDCKRVVQIGIRGSSYKHDDLSWPIQQGFRVVPARQCWYQSLEPLMAEVRQQMGEGPVYISFDIDALDPAFAPGTGTPEIGGLTTTQALEIIRGCMGLNVVGADVVEVSPMYDTTGTTCITAANLLFEILCVLPGVKHLPTPV